VSLVAEQNDAGLAEVTLAVAGGVALAVLEVLRRVDEGVERLGGDAQRIAGADLVHGSRSLPEGFRL